MDVKNGDDLGCGEITIKLCSNPCKNPDFLYHNEDNDLCYASMASKLAASQDCKELCGNDVSKL